jgi:hypothetical protein
MLPGPTAEILGLGGADTASVLDDFLAMLSRSIALPRRSSAPETGRGSDTERRWRFAQIEVKFRLPVLIATS